MTTLGETGLGTCRWQVNPHEKPAGSAPVLLLQVKPGSDCDMEVGPCACGAWHGSGAFKPLPAEPPPKRKTRGEEIAEEMVRENLDAMSIVFGFAGWSTTLALRSHPDMPRITSNMRHHLAKAIDKSIADEREACAKVADVVTKENPYWKFGRCHFADGTSATCTAHCAGFARQIPLARKGDRLPEKLRRDPASEPDQYPQRASNPRRRLCRPSS